MYLNTKQKKIKPNGNKLDKVNEKLNKLFEKLSEKLVSSKNKIHQERYRKAIETIDELMKSFIEKSTKEMFDFMDMAYEPMINFGTINEK